MFWSALLRLCVGCSEAYHETVKPVMTFQTFQRMISMAGLSNETLSDDTGVGEIYST